MWNNCRCSTRICPWPSLIYYLYKWYCWQTYITEQTICRWHFVWLFKSGHNVVENCYCSWFEWNGYMVQKWLMSFNPDKTEIMIFSNRSVPVNLDFSFNGKSVPITTSYKHLKVLHLVTILSGASMLIIFRVVYLKIWIFYLDWSTLLVALI